MRISIKECIECGVCCKWNPPSLAGCTAKIPAKNKMLETYNGVLLYIMRYRDGQCPYRSKSGCTIHKDRPTGCRIFRRGCSTCIRLREEAGIV